MRVLRVEGAPASAENRVAKGFAFILPGDKLFV